VGTAKHKCWLEMEPDAAKSNSLKVADAACLSFLLYSSRLRLVYGACQRSVNYVVACALVTCVWCAVYDVDKVEKEQLLGPCKHQTDETAPSSYVVPWS